MKLADPQDSRVVRKGGGVPSKPFKVHEIEVCPVNFSPVSRIYQTLLFLG